MGVVARWIPLMARRPACSSTRNFPETSVKGRAETAAGFPGDQSRGHPSVDLSHRREPRSWAGGRRSDPPGHVPTRSSRPDRAARDRAGGAGHQEVADRDGLAWYVDARPELVVCRPARCLPYGEGIAFSALGEVVNASPACSIDDPDESGRAGAGAPEVNDQEWLLRRLLSLCSASTPSYTDRDELFTAWRHFLS